MVNRTKHGAATLKTHDVLIIAWVRAARDPAKKEPAARANSCRRDGQKVPCCLSTPKRGRTLLDSGWLGGRICAWNWRCTSLNVSSPVPSGVQGRGSNLAMNERRAWGFTIVPSCFSF